MSPDNGSTEGSVKAVSPVEALDAIFQGVDGGTLTPPKPSSSCWRRKFRNKASASFNARRSRLSVCCFGVVPAD
jgi:hypothetical protein